jgi:hypothetical protein
LPVFAFGKKHLRINSDYISIRCDADGGKIRQTQRAVISLHFSVLGCLQIEPLLAERPKSLKYREIVADGMGLMGLDPRSPCETLNNLTLSKAKYFKAYGDACCIACFGKCYSQTFSNFRVHP